MRHAMKTMAGLMVVGALLAAGPTTSPPEPAWRKITIQLPGSVANSDSDLDQECYGRFAQALAPNNRNIEEEAVDHMSIPIPPATARNVATFWDVSDRAESLNSGQMAVRLSVQAMNQTDPLPSSDELNRLGDAVVETMRDQVARQWDRIVSGWKNRLDRGQQAVTNAEARLALTQARANAVEAKLHDLVDLPSDRMQAEQEALALERQKLELDLAGLKARQEALQQAVAQQAKKVDAAQSGDAVAEALKKAVEVARERLEKTRAMHKQGLAQSREVSEAELDELQAEARLAERRSAAGGSTEAMTQWNRTLTDATIEQREKEARLSAATKLLASLTEAAPLQKELKELNAQVAEAKEQLAKANSDLQPAKAWLDRYEKAQPVIEVKGNGPTTAPAQK